MAKVHLVTAFGDWPVYNFILHSGFEAFKNSAEADVHHVHTLTDDPEEADIILFTEQGTIGMFAEPVRAHPLYRRYPEKCFLYDSGDGFWPILPGVYTSITRKYLSPEHTRSGFYLLSKNPYLLPSPVTGSEKYLTSFIGSFNTHPLREKFLEYRRDDIYVMDTSKESYRIRNHGTPEEKDAFWQRYADSISNSLFSLCPRGRGPNSIRLYESMKMGRACVILSDEWIPNEKVDWESFSIHIPEADVARVPEILDKMRGRTAEMGLRAQQEWQKWFSESAFFHYVVELCVEMMNARKTHGLLRRLPHYRHILNPGNWRMNLRSKAILYRQNKKFRPVPIASGKS